MWKINFKDQLQLLTKLSLVKEILIINNDKNTTPDWFLTLNDDKLIEVRPQSNIFVNPAWNLGVRLAKCDHIFLNSDDVIVNSYDFISHIYEKISNEDCLIGCSESCYTYTLPDNPLIIDEVGNRPYGYGCMFFFPKKSFKPLPEQFKIWYGDDFLFQIFKSKNKAKSISQINMSQTKTGATTIHVLPVCRQDETMGYNSTLIEYLK